MLYILLGQDDFSLRQSLEEIKAGICDQALLEANTVTLDGQKTTVDQLRTACEAAPFLAEKRLVIVSGLLEHFESRSKSSHQKKTRDDQQNEHKLLAACVSELPSSTVLVFIDSNIKNNNPLFRKLSSKAEVRSFPLLRGANLRQWVQRHVAKAGGKISRQAVDLIAEFVGSDLWIMANEINKLVLFTAGRRIEEEDVKAVVSHSQQATVFTMIDAILNFRAGVAEQALQQLLQRGAHPAYFLVMLSRQVRILVRARELRSQGRPEVEIRNRLGLTSEFALRKTLEQADRYSFGRLKDIYHKLLETDLAIKTGKYDGELALNLLIAELCQKRQIQRV